MAVLDSQTVTVGGGGSLPNRSRGYDIAGTGSISDGTSDLYGGAVIRRIFWDENDGTPQTQFQVTGSQSNSGWDSLTINGTTFNRASAAFSTAGGNSTWTWNGGTVSMFGAVGSVKAVTFDGTAAGIAGTLNSSLDGLASTASGKISLTAALAGTLGPLAGNVSAFVDLQATLAASLDGSSLSSACMLSDPGLNGDLSINLDALASASMCVLPIAGSLFTANIGDMTAAASGTVTIPGPAVSTPGPPQPIFTQGRLDQRPLATGQVRRYRLGGARL